MATRLGKFELPNRLVKEEDTSTDTYAKFIADPFESGYGHTIGNAFRRVLLSSIEGAAISSLKFDGVQHEFQSIDGVVEDVTDYDKLLLEVTTDGRITPDDALKQSAAILRHHLDVFDQISEEQVEFESHTKEVSEEQNRLRNLLGMSVNEIELSVRAANCLNNANITTVGELATKSEPEMLKYRNFGKKSLNEIKAKLEQLGLSLGMKFESRLLETA